VILVDANILIYAIDADSPHHAAARPWLEGALSDGACWSGVGRGACVPSHHNQAGDPAPPAHVDPGHRLPDRVVCANVEAVGPGEQHWQVLRNLLKTTGTAGKFVSDSHLAALAIEHGYTVYSTDHDFPRFSGVEHVNPLA
jgi:uncharacterized protein